VKVLLVVRSDVGANSVATCGTKITEHNVAVGVKVWRKNDASYLRFKKRNRVICGGTFILNESINQSINHQSIHLNQNPPEHQNAGMNTCHGLE
jgi:hypothetical protein